MIDRQLELLGVKYSRKLNDLLEELVDETIAIDNNRMLGAILSSLSMAILTLTLEVAHESSRKDLINLIVKKTFDRLNESNDET